MRNRTSDYGAARVCKGINLRGREAYATVPNKATQLDDAVMHFSSPDRRSSGAPFQSRGVCLQPSQVLSLSVTMLQWLGKRYTYFCSTV